MKKVFLDSNVILDSILHRDGYEFVDQIFQFSMNHWIKNCTSVLSFANIAYILRKMPSVELQKTLSDIFKSISILPMGDMVVYNALKTNHPDFEDALQIACADQECCDLSITRDKRHYKDTPIPVYTPEEFYKATTEN